MKAWHRGWMEFSNGILASTFALIYAQDQQNFDLRKADIIAKLKILDANLKFNPYFDGDRYSLVDVCLASAFKPLTFIDKKFTLEMFDLHKNVATYVEGAVTRGSLHKALANDYEDIFKRFIEKKKSHLLTMSFSL
jgi:glutathione S-transferase